MSRDNTFLVKSKLLNDLQMHCNIVVTLDLLTVKERVCFTERELKSAALPNL